MLGAVASVPRVASSMLRTNRLLLRPWRDADRAPFAALNADAQVMEHTPAVMTRAASDVLLTQLRAQIDRCGFGLWAVEVTEESQAAPFVGFVGLNVPTWEAPFTPCVEVAWRLARHAWGRGYATEAARAAIDDGFGRLGFAEILAWTVPANVRSWRVMERLGMVRSPDDDFDHPSLPEGHPLRRHVLYRLKRPSSSPITI
jgi:RimJ/RimL family protein N-acetyltransferase